MQDFSQVQMLELGAVPNLGDLLGSQSSATLAEYINSYEDRSQFFGSSFDKLQHFRQQFVDQLVIPARQAGSKVTTYIQQVLNQDVVEEVKSLTTLEDLQSVPPYMVLPILTHPRINKLHKQGRINGYGIDPHHVKMIKPVYDRLIRDNGSINLSEPPKFGVYFSYQEFKSTDPYISNEQLDAIWDTYDLLDEVLDETDLDPTDPSALRG